MEKLIKLLNEWYLERYGTNPNFVKFEDYGGNDYGYFVGDDKSMVETEVWTKKYGFIERLVQNNKIDLDEINNNHLDTEIFYKQTYGPNYGEGGYGEIDYWYKCIGLYESLLCNLAISEDPIDLLCKRLK